METVEDLVKKQTAADPRLSFIESDIEKKFLFPAGTFTSAGPLLAPFGALFLAVLWYVIIFPFSDSHFGAMFTQRGVVPYVIVFFTAWSLMILLIKSLKINVQRKALALHILPTEEDPGFTLTPASAQRVLERLYKSVDDPKYFLLTRRIHVALSNLKNMGNISDVDRVLNTQADNDEAMVESTYTLLRGFVWAIPVLGFIGTVLGLSMALGSFGNVMSSAGEMAELKTALQHVTAGLSTAFETTLLGLVSALCIQMIMTGLKRKEEQFLDACKDYCQKNIVNRLRLMKETPGS